MAKINIEKTREALQAFDFRRLFIRELGWSNPANKPSPGQTQGVEYTRTPVAELSGAVVLEITCNGGKIPTAEIRKAIAVDVAALHFEHIAIFIDSERTQSIWHWQKKQDKKSLHREHQYIKGQPGDLFIAKLVNLATDLSDFDKDGKMPIAEVARRLRDALDVERVTKKFFGDYQQQHVRFLELIEGIDNDHDRRWYASVLLNRLMFIYFLQKKLFLDKGDHLYLSNKLRESQQRAGANHFYSGFLNTLFFEGFAKPEHVRPNEVSQQLGRIPYLNGGLFLRHGIELRYPNIKVPDDAFANLFELFDRYSWTLDDTPGGNDNEINPDVLGYIFEKYINQKAFGAYYTRPEITEYLCEQTIYQLILDQINDAPLPNGVPDELAAKLKPRRFASVPEMLLEMDAGTIRKLLTGTNAVLPTLSILDPACGSGAFLVAAMKTLINVYAAVLGRIEFLNDPKLSEWLEDIRKSHPSVNYYIKKQIISNNLFGVDIMEEATEIAKLRLFLALVSSAEKAEQLEPLPNIDFNILAGNSLIGMLRVNNNRFDQRNKPKNIQYDIFSATHVKSYADLVVEKEAAVRAYRSQQLSGNYDLQALRESIEQQRAQANETLHNLLLEEFINLKIQFEEAAWDETQGKEGKPKKRPLNIHDVENLHPFHWGYEFSEIFNRRDGFDAIITNPPWEIFKPQAKEFFADHSTLVTKNNMTIKDFEKEQATLLQNAEIRSAWLEYLSRFPHESLYYRSAKQYENQISVVNGKKAGTDINLYKLFTEQCFNLLRPGGACGIVIPSGIYTDLGAKQLREMLFSKTKVTGLFSFENRKKIFEDVDSRFKFVILGFEKGGMTSSFHAAFMRHDVRDLEHFPDESSFLLTIDFIRSMSPDNMSIMEIKNQIDFEVLEKMSKFPILGDEDAGVFVLRLNREFDMTNDSHLFSTKPEKNSIPLFEGKMVHQFNPEFAKPKYWVDEQEGRQSILGRRKDSGQILDYQTYRLGFRDIASDTNERTFISTITKNVFHGNKLPQTKIYDDAGNRLIANDSLLYLCALWNSFVVDWHIRLRVTTTLNFHFVYNTPIPRLTEKDRWYRPIVERAARLVCTTPEFAALWEEVMNSKWASTSGATHEADRARLRAELDGIIAHVYGLTEEEFAYVLGTFPVVKEGVKAAAMEAYQLVEKGKL